MAKAAAIQHACSECGYTTGKWLGKCPTCGSWGTLVEERSRRSPKGRDAGGGRPLLRLVDVEAADAERIPTGVAELDRVLGGGLVPASLVLVSGDPGIGKSTLLLMALRSLSAERPVLLVTGEESAAQVKLRADRLGGGADVHILAETNLDEVCATLERERPEVLRDRLGADALRARARLGAGLGGPGARGRRAAAPRREGGGIATSSSGT